MKLLVSLILLALMMSSCESTPKKEVHKEEKVKTVISIRESRDAVISPPLEKPKKKKKRLISPETKPKKQRWPSLCPAGLHGGLVGKIEDGRYCFSSPDHKSCYKKNDGEVQRVAHRHCQNYLNKLKQADVWGRKGSLMLSSIKNASCHCQKRDGENYCMSYFSFRCESSQNRKRPPKRKWEDLKYKSE